MKLMKVTEPAEVLKIIEENFLPLGLETVALEEAGGRCLGEDVVAGEQVPGFERSTVDGYAVAARDTFGAQESLPAVLECVGEVLMGESSPPVKAGQCCLVHTGGMLPAGADAVVMIEDTGVMGSMVHSYRQVAPGENVIHKGEDLEQGEPVLSRGSLLRAPELGLLASLGITELTVYRRPVMGLLSSGDELVPHATASLAPGRIRDSNSIALNHLGRQAGAMVKRGGILRDSFETFIGKSRSLLKEVDFLVLSGGSSVGDRDFTARTLRELGPPGVLVEGIAIQPGKPTLLASCGGKPVLGLPGHPVSALVIFSLFGRAILRRLSGRTQQPWFPSIKATLDRNISSRTGRTDFIRVKLSRENGAVKASPLFGRSGMLRTLADADGIMAIAPEKEGLAEGETIEVYLWE